MKQHDGDQEQTRLTPVQPHARRDQEAVHAGAALLQRRIVMHSRGSSGLVSSRALTWKDVEQYIAGIGVANHAFDDIIEATGKEYSIIAGPTPAKRKLYRKKLIENIVSDMHKTQMELYFKSDEELVSEIRKRTITSLDMRVSQGITRRYKPVAYPPRTRDSWAAVANSAARKYWRVTIVSGDYWFTLKPPGKENAYEALTKLIFAHQARGRQTLMHCDYVISALHYKVMADSMGPDKFNDEVRKGNIQIKLHDLTIDPITQEGVESKPNKSLARVELNSENDLIIGDHVIFYNHPAYDALNENVGQSWRLENAIAIDNEGPGKTKRFQGHGFFAPKPRKQFVEDMSKMFNILVRRAMRYVAANDLASLRRYFTITKGSTVDRTVDFDLVGRRVTNARIKYQEGTTLKEIPLRELKSEDYEAPLVAPGESRIRVWRPMESRSNL